MRLKTWNARSNRCARRNNVVLADTNILSTFAKIGELPLLLRLFAEEGIGVVPAVYEELHQGVSKGYVALQAAIELIQRRHIELVVPSTEETLGKSALPASFDAGERETIAVARARGAKILTNERLVKNRCAVWWRRSKQKIALSLGIKTTSLQSDWAL